jgi:hypothetical protein
VPNGGKSSRLIRSLCSIPSNTLSIQAGDSKRLPRLAAVAGRIALGDLDGHAIGRPRPCFWRFRPESRQAVPQTNVSHPAAAELK